MISINDKRILSVKVVDNHEKLVNILDLPRIYLPSQIVMEDEERHKKMDDTKTPYLRETVKEKLGRAIANLPKEYSILLREAYRKYDVQKYWYEKYFNEYKEKYPELSENEIVDKIKMYVSDPDKYSPHVTGGAIDLALLNKNREMVDVGQYIEKKDAAQFDYKGLNKEQRKGRELLKSIMTEQGFVNYPYEWWHYSYGDKYWGYMKKIDAIYDSVQNVTVSIK